MAGSGLERLFLALAVIVAGAALARWAFLRLRLPGVVGELLLGIALGPSLLGWLWPDGHGALFPASGAPILHALSWVGLALFVYHVGLEMHWEHGDLRPVLLVALGGLLVPMASGVLLAAASPSWFFAGAGEWPGRLMVGIVLTVSALPVLARILEDLGMLGSRLGSVALGAATVDDVVGWTLMAVVAAAGSVGLTGLLWANVLAVAGLGAALWVGASVLRKRMVARPAPFPAVMAAVLLAAWLTEAAGLSAVLGPLAVGAFLSGVPAMREDSRRRIGDVTKVLLLPIFFVMSGAAVDLRLLPMPAMLLPLAILLASASLAKVAGCSLGARAAGLPWRDGLAAGSLLNARGAVGLVVVRVGLDAGLFSVGGYSLLVVVVALTTLAAPILARTVLAPAPAAAAATSR
jgi:Kef-type K+ transport system membrane component KefB